MSDVRSCPLCAGEMVPAHAAAADVERCATCGATWFDARELAGVQPAALELEETLRGRAHRRAACRVCGANTDGVEVHCGLSVHTRCPTCCCVLARGGDETVLVDVCFGCGGFLVDRDSLARLPHWVPAVQEAEEPLLPLLNPSAIEALVGRAKAAKLLI